MGTFSDNLLLSLLAFGESTANGFDNWGESANFNFNRLDGKLGNRANISLTASDVTLSAGQEASIYLAFTGILAANRTVNLSIRPGFWFVSNETTGGFEVRFEPDDGTALVIPAGKSIVYSDGAAPVLVSSASKLGFCAHKNGVNQAVVINTAKITFGTEAYDDGGYYDAANSRWTPPAGRHHVSVAFTARQTTPGSTLALTLELRKNGVAYARGFTTVPGANYVVQATLSRPIEANGTDYFEIWAVNENGNFSGDIRGAVVETWFCGEAV